MTESEFNQCVDDTLLAIEEVLDEAETDIDYENVGGVLNVTCENGSAVIFTRQAPVQQLWVATKGGGFHFDYDQESASWRLQGADQSLNAFLQATFEAQAGESLPFDS